MTTKALKLVNTAYCITKHNVINLKQQQQKKKKIEQSDNNVGKTPLNFVTNFLNFEIFFLKRSCL